MTLYLATSVHYITAGPAHTVRSTVLLSLGNLKFLYTKLQIKIRFFREGSSWTLGGGNKLVKSVKDTLRFSKKLANPISILRNGNSDFTNDNAIATVVLAGSRLYDFFFKIFARMYGTQTYAVKAKDSLLSNNQYVSANLLLVTKSDTKLSCHTDTSH